MALGQTHGERGLCRPFLPAREDLMRYACTRLWQIAERSRSFENTVALNSRYHSSISITYCTTARSKQLASRVVDVVQYTRDELAEVVGPVSYLGRSVVLVCIDQCFYNELIRLFGHFRTHVMPNTIVNDILEVHRSVSKPAIASRCFFQPSTEWFCASVRNELIGAASHV